MRTLVDIKGQCAELIVCFYQVYILRGRSELRLLGIAASVFTCRGSLLAQRLGRFNKGRGNKEFEPRIIYLGYTSLKLC